MWKKRTSRLRNVARVRTILGVFAAHGFHEVVARVKLGRFVIDRLVSPDLEHLSTAERVRMSFEQLGPTFVKLGQLLATRPDLVPLEFSQEFRKLHDQVTGITFSDIEAILQNHFGAPLHEVFASFEETPLAAASIAQVHRARLKDGTSVVVKVQRPGIERGIQEDIQILRGLAELADRYIPEIRLYNPVGIINEFGRSMEQETNFIIEANNVRRFAHNFANHSDIKVPKVFAEYTGRRVLVLEALDGIPLSQSAALKQEGLDPEEILKRGLRAYMKMVYTDGLFHGDLHAGNVLLLANNKIGLIDFGIVGRLNRKTQSAIANMFLALAEEDYDRLAYLYIDLAPFTERVDGDQFARDIRDLIAPYFGLTLKNVNLGRLLLDSTAVASRHGLVLPSELVLFFKSIVSLEGMGRMLLKDFDFLSYSMEFAKELVQVPLDPRRMFTDASVVARDMNSMISAMPRQVKQVLRKINDPDFAIRIHSSDIKSLRRAIQSGSWVIFWGLILSALILGLFINQAKAELIYKPRDLKARTARLVVVVHGCLLSSEYMALGTGFNKIADKHNLVVLYPQVPAESNGLDCWNWFLPENQNKESGQLREIADRIRSLKSELRMANLPAYLMGISSGAATASGLLACFPGEFSAAAIVAGTSYGLADNVKDADRILREGPPPTPTRGPCSPRDFRGRMLVVQGKSDQVVNPKHAPRIIADFITTDPADSEEKMKDGTSSYLVFDFKNRARLVMVDGLGHAWPGYDSNLRNHQEVGPNKRFPTRLPFFSSAGPNATQLIWQFFSESSL